MDVAVFERTEFSLKDEYTLFDIIDPGRKIHLN